MNKIICDVCGTAYPETASQCPICGSATVTDAVSASGENLTDKLAASSYNYVKGGRFSKKNVRKRSLNQPETRVKKQERPVREEIPDEEFNDLEIEQKPKSNRGLVITVFVLLLAILAVVMYLALKYFIPVGGLDTPSTTLPPAQTSSVETTDDGLIHCTNLNLTDTVVNLDGEGRQWLLNVTAEPFDTTDVITYSSSDESVVTVSESGTLTAVAEGTAVITITCGDASVECTVNCDFPEPTTAPVETQPAETQPAETQPVETTAPAADPSKKYTMRVNGTTRKTYDITIKVGSSITLTLTDEDGNVVDVDWKTNGPSYLTIKGNKITAKAPYGALKVYVTIGETTYTCTIRVVK